MNTPQAAQRAGFGGAFDDGYDTATDRWPSIQWRYAYRPRYLTFFIRGFIYGAQRG